jgi:hypothetical protein
LAFELVVVYFLFVETGNMSLEETAVILDGEDYENRLVGTTAAIAEKKLGAEGNTRVTVETKTAPGK